MKKFSNPSPILKKAFISFLFIFGSLASFSQTPIPYGKNPKAGKFVEVNGINLYYEIYGSGEPLLLLHGNGGSIAGHREKIDFFKKHYKVIVPDNRAHGKSIDTTNTKISYELMAADINVLMDSLGVENAYIWGQSDGGIMGLLLAIKHPEKVKRLATFGANLVPGPEAIQDELHEMVMETLETTKDPHTKKLYSLLAYHPNISLQELQSIKCPVLIMSGDRDAVKLEHSISIFRNIPKSNFFVMPGASHFGSYEKPELFNLVLLDFFSKPFKMNSTIEKLIPKQNKDVAESSATHK